MSLTAEEIRKLTHKLDKKTGELVPRPGVNLVAVQNFLGTMGTNVMDNYGNARADAASYRWNAPTLGAIMKGIKLQG
jgi:hypothetical protein